MDKETLIAHLNEDLAGELGAIIQYITYARQSQWTVPARNWRSFSLPRCPMSNCTRSSLPTKL